MASCRLELAAKIDLEKFLSIHAHDLKTPFNHITGFSKMILNHLGNEPLTEFQKEDLGTVYRSGQRALMLLNGLVDIARYNRGETKFMPTDFDLQPTLDESLVQWKKFNPSLPYQPEYRLDASSRAMHRDELLLRQVIIESISYVALFVEGEAKLHIEVKEENGQFLFSFRSEGEKARLASAMDLEMQGFLSRAFTEMNGGQIVAAEENDRGALLQITFPIK